MADPSDELAILGISYTNIEGMPQDELDRLPFGTIQLDAEGRVLSFNMYESSLSQLPKSAVLGKDFFREVAPCTDVKEFRGRFREGLAQKSLHAKFNYHFAFKQNPRDVQVTLFYSDLTNSIWVFVQPR